MFKRVKKNWNMLWPLLALTVVAVIIFLERMGVAENFLKGDQEIAQNERTRPTIEIPDTVLFVSRRESNSADFASEMEQILDDPYSGIGRRTCPVPHLRDCSTSQTQR